MKKRIVMFFAAAIVAVCACADTWTDPETGYTWTYRVNGDEAELYNSLGAGAPAISSATIGVVTIPATLGGKTVTSIGNYAFFGCYGLEGVNICSTITNIGYYAFNGCSGIRNVTIPDSVTRIDTCAFKACSGLTSVIIGSDVRDIGDWAFLNCSALANVSISESVTSIGGRAFEGCAGLTSVNIPEGVTNIGYSAFKGCSGLKNVTIPGSVVHIGDWSFQNCSGLTGVSLGNGLTSIGFSMFEGCTELRSIDIPGSVTNIRYRAFSGCDNLCSIRFEGNAPDVGDWDFSGIGQNCVAFVSRGTTGWNVDIPGTWHGMQISFVGAPEFNIFNGEFLESVKLNGATELTIPDGVKYFYGGGAIEGSGYLKKVTMPNSMTKIESAFEGCCNLAEITLSTNLTRIGLSAFSGCSSLTNIVIPDSVTSIEAYAFLNCSSLTSVILPDSVTSLKGRMFDGCSSLANVNIPDGVADIPFATFRGCKSLTSITIPDSVTSIGFEAFSDCKALECLSIPTNVMSIGAQAFAGCSGLTSLVIPTNVISIGTFAFAGCDGVTDLSATQIPHGLPTGRVRCVTIPEGVTSIANHAFEGCGALETVSIPDSVTSIGWHAFEGCNSLRSVKLPETLTSIGVQAFRFCGSLEEIVLPDSITSIGSNAFEGCGSLKSIVIPKGVAGIPFCAFYGCSALSNVEIPFGVTSIGGNAFLLCGSLKSITIPNGVTTIGEYAFRGCGRLESLMLPESMTSIAWHAFEDCSRLKSIIIPNGVTTIGASTFRGCKSLIKLVIPDGVTDIGSFAFEGCVAINDLTIPASATNISATAFSGCTGVKSLTAAFVPEGIPKVQLTSITIPPNTTSIGEAAFSGCTSLTNFTISVGVESIGAQAFSMCSGLTEVTIPDSVTSIGNAAFSGCSSLTNLTISVGVESIGDEAFSMCSGLTEVTIPDSVTNIGNAAFYNMNNLQMLTIPSWLLERTVRYVADWRKTKNIIYYEYGYIDGLKRLFAKVAFVKQEDFYEIYGRRYFDEYGSDRSSVNVYKKDGDIPTTLKHISVKGGGEVPQYAFYACHSVESIELPNTMTNIGYNAFGHCSNLASISIPDSVTSIENEAFYGCNSLTNLIASHVHSGIPKDQLVSVTIPDGITIIRNSAFSGCGSLASVTIGNGVTSICDFAFSGCSSLTSVTIPDSVTSVGPSAFSDCIRLASVTIPFTVMEIGDYAFSGCKSLHKVVLPGWLRGTFNESTFSGNADDFEIVYIDGVGIYVNAHDMDFREQEDCLWSGDVSISHDGIASARLKGMGQDSESSIELQLDSPGRLSFWWKASSESDGNNVFDYAYLSIDGVPQGTLNKEKYSLNGVAIGGKTGWRHEVIDVAGKGSHVIRWTYAKDEVDEGDTGDDCVWLDEVEFTPLAYLSFDIAGGIGTAPAEISELEGTVVTLPAQSGFEWEDHVFNGWSDGKATYAAESQYVVSASNVTFTAQWIAKRFLTFALDGGDGQIPIAIKDVPGAEIKLPSANGISRAKHVFVGWSDGATTYDAGAKYRVTDASVEFKAVWQRKEAHVSIVSDDVVNGGTVDTQGATISMSAWTNPSVGTPAIYYTLDGTEPTTSSTRYEGPFFVGTLGDVTVRAFAVLDDCFDGEATFSFTRLPYSLSECVAMEGVNVAVGGATPWFRVTGEAAHDGKAAMRSGVIGDGENSYVEMQVRGEAEVSFWWKISSQNKVRTDKHDYLAFSVDGEEALTLGGGVIDWTNATYAVTGSGRHSLRWTYIKDGADASNEDCAWLDDVVWSPTGKLCAVSFNANGGEVSECERKVREGSSVGTLPQPQRYCYDFDGWFTAADGGDEIVSETEVTDNVTYYAHWKVSQYTVMFDANGGTGGMTVVQDYGAALSAPLVGREGYTFDGWSPAVPATVPAGGATYTAQWKVNQYAVVFDANGGEGSITNVLDYASEVVAPDVSRTGYAFAGWLPEIEASVPASNVVYIAQWTINKYTVTFDANGNTDGAGAPADGLWAYYLLDGNACDASGNGHDFTEVANDPLPTTDRFGNANCAYEFNGNSAQRMDIYAENDAEHRSSAVIGTFSFAFWFQTNSSYTDYGAGWAWNLGNYAVFPSHGGFYSDERGKASGLGVKVGVDGIELVEHADVYMPTKLTYQADVGNGWHHVAVTVEDSGRPILYLDGAYVATGETSDRTRVFRPNVGGWQWGYYTGKVDDLMVYSRALSATEVKALYDGFGEVEVVERMYDEMLGVLPTPTLEGHSFDGWYTAMGGGEKINASTKVTGNATYYAHWIINQYTVTFNANGGVGGKSVTQYYGTELSAPTVTREGYTFDGWSPVIPATVPAGDVTYTAQWKANRYTVTFNANGGTGGKAVTQDYGTAIIAPTVTRAGYTLTGWSPAVPSTMPAGNTTYTAQWTTKKYTVKFDANGGVGGTSGQQDYGSVITAPTVTRTGYTFTGWQPVVLEMVPASNVTYTAQWKINAYTVTFEGNGGGTGDAALPRIETTQDYGTVIVAPTVTRTGYTFTGWQPVVLETVPASNVTYTAQWKINAYTVTFEGNGGGTGDAALPRIETTQDYGTVIVAPAVTRTGYTFTGWQPMVLESVPASNVTYTAQWTANRYTIAFSANGGTGAMASQRMVYDAAAKLSPNGFVRKDAWFMGWSAAPGGELAYVDGARVMNLTSVADGVATLYAVWKMKPVSVLACEEAFGGAGVVTMDEDNNIVVTLTNNVSGTVEIPDNVGSVTIDLNGHDIVGDGGGHGVTALPGPAIRIVSGKGDGEATRLAIGDTSNGEKGQIAGGGKSAGIEIAEGAAHGVSLDVDDAVSVLNGDGTEQDCSLLGKASLPWPTDGAYNPLVANVYDGYALGDDGALVGIVQVKAAKQAVKTVTDKVTKAKTATTNVAVTATVTDAAGKKWSYSKGVGTVDGVVTGLVCTTKGVLVPSFGVTLGANGLSGKWGGSAIEGARNGMDVKGGAMMAALDAHYKKSWSVAFTNKQGATRLQIVVGAKGSTKISGTTADGYKVSATVQGVMGEDAFLVPYLATLKNGKLSRIVNLLLSFGKDGTVVAHTSDLGGLKAAGPTTDNIKVLPYAESASSKGGEAYAGAVVLNDLAYPAKFAAKGLPAGLKIDAATGAITGTPTKPGHYTATITVTSGVNGTKKVETTVEFNIGNYTDASIGVKDSYSGYCVGVMAREPIAAARGCTASGLPAGLKFAASETKDKTFGTVAAGTVYGVPTKAGEYTVYFVKSEKKNGKTVNHQASATFRVEELPTWAQGDFAGYAAGTRDACPYHGSATMTVGSTGKISGKIALEGTNWTFSAEGYAAVERPSSDVDEATFIVNATAKAGKETRVVELEVCGHAGRVTLPDGGFIETALPNGVAEGTFGDGEMKMWRNMWKDKATASAAKATIGKFEGVYTVSMEAEDGGSDGHAGRVTLPGGYLSLTVGKDGNVKAAGKLADGTGVSASSPLVYDEDAGWFVVLYAAPSAYKGGAFAAVVGFSADDTAVAGRPPYRLTPVLFAPQWTSRSPEATGEYGDGFDREVSFTGAYYDKLEKLRKYYESVRVGLGGGHAGRVTLPGAPELGYTFKETSLNEQGRKVTTSSVATASAVDTLDQAGMTAKVDEKGALVVAKATKPVQDKDTKEWSYGGANDGALTLSFTQATGIFKGSYTFWYDYVSAYDATKDKETLTHTSKKVNFEGILVQGEEPLMDGFYLWDATGEYADPKTGKPKTYKYKLSFPVRLSD